jgi:hypothetical protein
MNCNRRECEVSMRKVDAFPRIPFSAGWLTIGLVVVLAAIFLGLASLA